jgi:hypothetical protein
MRRGIEEVPAQCRLLGTMTVCEQAIVADAMEAIGQHVK